MDPDYFTVLGWVWFELNALSYDEDNGSPSTPVEGYEIWRHVARRLRVGEKEFDSSVYVAFKDALKELESIEAIRRCGPEKERKRARILWLPTAEGQRWWDEKGYELHGDDRARDARTGIALMPPMKKWVDLSTVNGPTRRLLITKIFSGQVQVALRSVERDEV